MDKYKVGSKIILLSMDDPDPLPIGSTGIVSSIANVGGAKILSIRWDEPNQHRSLNVCEPEDKFSILEY